jgi:hypothetical protein
MDIHVNFFAVFIAALANFLIATVWYAFLFGSLWRKLTGISDMKPAPAKVAMVFIGSVVISFVLLHSIVFGNAYLKFSGLRGGLMGGFFSWLGFIAPVTLTNVVYEKRSWKLWLLDNCFWLISLLVMGAILSVSQ